MSVFRGFSTRKQEQDYGTNLFRLLHLLSKRCLMAIKNEHVDDQKFAAVIGKLYAILTKMEDNKQVGVKYSEGIYELANHLGLKDNSEVDIVPRISKPQTTNKDQKPKLQLKVNSFMGDQCHRSRCKSNEPINYTQTQRKSASQSTNSPNNNKPYKTLQIKDYQEQQSQVQVMNHSQHIQINPMNYKQIVINNKLPPDDDAYDKVQTSEQNFKKYNMKSIEEKEKEFLALFGK